LPRLVAADWLDEHGYHDRAEFIRLQHRIESAITRVRNPAFDTRDMYNLLSDRSKYFDVCAWQDREADLFRSIAADLIRDIEAAFPRRGFNELTSRAHRGPIRWFANPPPANSRVAFVWRCGFVSEVRATSRFLQDVGPRLVAVAPVDAVVAFDRTPNAHGDDAGVWGRRDSRLLPNDAILPEAVFARLPAAGRTDLHPDGGYAVYQYGRAVTAGNAAYLAFMRYKAAKRKQRRARK
jgi:hypothetical protein